MEQLRLASQLCWARDHAERIAAHGLAVGNSLADGTVPVRGPFLNPVGYSGGLSGVREMMSQADLGTGSDVAAVQLRTIPQELLARVLAEHRQWLLTQGAEGARADLSGTNLQGLSFWRADLRRAAFARSDLRHANLDHADLSGASLEGSNMERAPLWEASLRGASLAGSNLRRAKLDHADLCGANLADADLTGASLWGAHLEGADLSAARGLVRAQLDHATRDGRTRLPEQSFR